MSRIKKILRYYFHHRFSDKMVERVQRRLIEPGDERECEEALRELWDEIGLPGADRRSEASLRRVKERLGWRRFLIPSWARAAIWFIPVLSLGISIYLYGRVIGGRDVPAVAPKETFAWMERSVPAGQRDRLVLPDSSEIWLNAGTSLIYPSEFTGDRREVYLIGEAYFKVAKRPERPFVVRMRSMRIEVLGTSFNVSAYPGMEKITTTLAEGSLRVLPDDPSVESHVLTPNEQLEYAPALKEMSLRKVVASNYSSWKEGGLLFNNDSLEYILKTLEHVYGVEIHLRTSAYHANRLTMHLNKNESLENVLALIKVMIPAMDYHVEGKKVYIE